MNLLQGFMKEQGVSSHQPVKEQPTQVSKESVIRSKIESFFSDEQDFSELENQLKDKFQGSGVDFNQLSNLQGFSTYLENLGLRD